MNLRVFIAFFITSCTIKYTVSIGFFYPVVIASSSALYAGWNYVKCFTYECCNDETESLVTRTWILFNQDSLSNLQTDLSSKLYGQPLASDIVYKAVKSHVIDKEPQKPLVLSFHGWTGSGKNHVSQIIAENLYKKGSKSKYVHVISSPHYFPDHDPSSLPVYKRFLKNYIEEAVTKCPRNLFVFDEVDKMPLGLIDTINPFLDYNLVAGLDYRKCIFIFLSNTGGTEIVKLTHEFWKQGKERREITMKHVEKLIQAGAFNEKGGFHKSDFIAKNLIDFYVPFLPLERKHVKLCIKDYVNSKYNTSAEDDFLEKVANEIEFDPPDIQLYSKTGCKRIPKKVDVFISD